jgi:proline iminopeptidase
LIAKLHVTAAFLAFCLFLSVPQAFAARNARLAAGDHVAFVNGLRFHYVVGGHGPLLVVQAPGWGIGSAYLENGLAPLREHFTLLVFDPRGTGGSSPVAATGRLTNGDLAEDLEQLRNYWGLETMDLVGHSNGSAIAILYAERYPARVRKLVLIGSQLLGYQGGDNPDKAAERARRKSDPEFAYYLAHIDDPAPKTDEAFTQYFEERAGFYCYNPAKDVPAFLKTMTRSMSASVYQAFLESPPASQAPPLADLSKISAKTLVIDGRQDPVCPPDESERIHAGIAGSKLVVIDKSGHFPWIEQPGIFFPAVSQFLEK